MNISGTAKRSLVTQRLQCNYRIAVSIAICSLLRLLASGKGVQPDPGFTSSLGTGLQAAQVLPQPDQSLLVLAHQYGYPQQQSTILRLRPDGSPDLGFHTYSNDFALFSTLATNSTGQIYAGGQFAEQSGTLRGFLIRLNPDGALDLSFSPGFNEGGWVESIAIEASGDVLVGGGFTNINGSSSFGLARLHANGAVDENFQPKIQPTYHRYGATVHAIAVQQNGSIVVGGEIMEAGIVSGNRIARFLRDGTPDHAFQAGRGPDLPVGKLLIQPDGRILVGGRFSFLAGQPRRRIARLNVDGSLDRNFKPTLGVSLGRIQSFPSECQLVSIAIDAEQRILIAGSFQYVDGLSRSGVARLFADGSIDPEFDAGYSTLFPGSPQTVSGVALDPIGRVLACAANIYADGSFRPGLGRFVHRDLDSAGTIEFATAVESVSEGARSVQVGLSRLNGLHGSVSVTVQTVEGTAVAGVDYTSRSTTVTFAEGETSQTVSIPILDDRIAEDKPRCGNCIDPTSDTAFQNEIFYLQLLNPSGGARLGSQIWNTVEILDNDVAFAFSEKEDSVGEVWMRENLTVRRIGDLTRTNHVSYATLDGTATAGLDFQAASGTLTFLPGEQEHSIQITLLPDRLVEKDETFSVTLQSPSEGTVLTSPAVIRVTLQDHPETHLTPFAGGVDDSFYPSAFSHGSITSILEQPDGNILIAGLLSPISDPWKVLRISRIHPDGSNDPTFNAADAGLWTDTTVAVALQPDGKILIAGPRMLRLNSDGSPDDSFPTLDLEGGSALCLEIQSDRSILLGGSFTRVAGSPRPWVARITPDGKVDPTLALIPSLLPTVYSDPSVQSIALQPDGRIVIGGDFAINGNNIPQGLARLNTDGSLDSSFVLSSNFSGFIQVLRLDGQGRILVGGNSFPSPLFSLARLEPSGAIDDSFRPPVDPTSDSVASLAIRSDGRILAGGPNYGRNGPVTAIVPSLRRLTPDGALDPEFDPGAYGPFGNVTALLLESRGSLLVGGDFSSVDGRLIRSLVRIRDQDPLPFAPVILTSSGGSSVKEGADVRLSVAAWGFPMPGFQWYRDAQPVPGSTTSNLNMVGVAPRLAGSYTVVVSNALGSITSSPAILNISPAPRGPGAVDIAFRSDTLSSEKGLLDRYEITALAVDSQDRVIVSSRGRYYETTYNDLTRLNPDGSRDPTFDGGAISQVEIDAMVIQPDGRIVVLGGPFLGADRHLSSLARLETNGVFDPSFVTEGWFDRQPKNLAIQADGKLLAVGLFTALGGVERFGIARLNADGSLDDSFHPPMASARFYWLNISVVAVQPDRRIVIGGSFAEIGGVPRKGLARLNPDGSLDVNYNPNLPGWSEVFDLALLPDGRLLVAGAVSAGESPRLPGLVRLDLEGSLDSSFDASRMAKDPYFVERILALDHGKILVTGITQPNQGNGVPYCIRLLPNGTRDEDFSTGSGPSDRIQHLAVQSDAGVFIGGVFLSVDGRPRHSLAHLLGDPSAAGSQVEFESGTAAISESSSATLELKVHRIGAGTGTLTVDYGIAGGSATADEDFVFHEGTLTFDAGGPRNLSIPIQVLQDLLPEGEERVKVWLANPIGGAGIGAFGEKVILINDDDRAITFSTNRATAYEGTGLLVDILRLGNLEGTERVRLRTIDGTAKVGQDFSNLDVELIFPPGVNKKILPLRFLTDSWGAPDRSFELRLEEPLDGLVIGTIQSLKVTILDDDRPGSVDTRFNLAVPTEISLPLMMTANSVEVVDNGKILIGGHALNRTGFVDGIVWRLRSDGSLDSDFHQIILRGSGGYGSDVRAIHWNSKDERIAAAGSFLIPGCIHCNGVARFEADGTFDSTFSGTPYLSPFFVSSIAPSLLDDQLLYVCGSMYYWPPGVPALRQFLSLVRLNEDGTLDPTFHVIEGSANVIAPLRDGGVYLGASSANGSGNWGSVLRRMRADGSTDESFDSSKAFPSDAEPVTIHSLLPLADGRLFVAGAFNLGRNSPWHLLARLNSDGTLDPSFVPEIEFQSSTGQSIVNKVLLGSDGGLLVAGHFHLPENPAAIGLARLNADGSLDRGFDSVEITRGRNFYDAEVRDLALQPDGAIVIAGTFRTLNGLDRRGVARILGGRSLSIVSVLRAADGTLKLSCWIPTTHLYAVEASPNLMDWVEITRDVFNAGTVQWTDDSDARGANRFYRLRPVQ